MIIIIKNIQNKLNNIYNPILIPKRKQIYAKWRIGMDNFNLEKYIWQDDTLVLMKKYEENWSNDTTGSLSITRLENNKYLHKDSIVKQRSIEEMYEY